MEDAHMSSQHIAEQQFPEELCYTAPLDKGELSAAHGNYPASLAGCSVAYQAGVPQM